MPIVKSIDIQFVGAPSVSKEKILANMRTRVGKPYSPQITEEDIRNLYATGNVTNVRMFGEPQGNGVKVVVVVATKSSVSEIIINGATRVKASKLREQISTKPGDALTEASLEADRQKILEYYQGKGYGDVDVRSRTEGNEKGVPHRLNKLSESLSHLHGSRPRENVRLMNEAFSFNQKPARVGIC